MLKFIQLGIIRGALLFTYADLDATKYKALQGSLKDAFGSSVNDQLKGMIDFEGLASSDKPVTVMIPLDKDSPQSADAPVVKVEVVDAPDVSVEAEAKARQAERAGKLEKQLSNMIEKELQGSRIQVEREDNKVVIRFPSEIAFSARPPRGDQRIRLRSRANDPDSTTHLRRRIGRRAYGRRADHRRAVRLKLGVIRGPFDLRRS